jgi:geranylgeranyl pyrophosphate synthase
MPIPLGAPEASVAAALARVDEAVGALDPALAAHLAAAIAPARAAAAWPGWPPTALPLAVGAACGLAAPAAERLAAASVLFFASADVVDDAQDGDLPAEPWGGWPTAVAVGLALVFASQREAMAAVLARAGAIAAAFAEAGLAMSLGQARDVAVRTTPWDRRGHEGAGGGGHGADLHGEAAYLARVRAKTGGSIALFATLGAIAADAPAASVAALHAWGEATGAALQLLSDLADAEAPASRDRAAGRVTLPVARAWARLAPAERPLLEAAWRGEPDAADLAFLIARTGAATHARARAAALRLEAREALGTAGLDPALVAGLDAWAEALAAAAPGAL